MINVVFNIKLLHEFEVSGKDFFPVNSAFQAMAGNFLKTVNHKIVVDSACIFMNGSGNRVGSFALEDIEQLQYFFFIKAGFYG